MKRTKINEDSEYETTSSQEHDKCCKCKRLVVSSKCQDDNLIMSSSTECSSMPEIKTVEEMIPELSDIFYGKGRGAEMPFELDSLIFGETREAELALIKKDSKPILTQQAPKLNKREAKLCNKTDWNEEVDLIFSSTPVSEDPKVELIQLKAENKQLSSSSTSTAELIQSETSIPVITIADIEMKTQLESLSKTLTSLFFDNFYPTMCSSDPKVIAELKLL